MKKLLVILLVLMLTAAMPIAAYAEGTSNIIDTAIDYGWIIFAAAVVLVIVVIGIIKFFRTPREEQLKKVREWLLLAVITAEQKFGSETGVIKLRFVYDLFVSKFPWIAKILSFDKFSELVDEALDKMRLLLEENPKILTTSVNCE